MDLFNDDVSGVAEELQKTKSEIASSKSYGGDRKIFKFELGEQGNRVRVLPPLYGKKLPWEHVKIHFNLIGSNGKQMALLCGMLKFDECPLCREAALFREAGDNLKSWNAMAKDQYIYNVIDPEGEVALMTADRNLQEELVKQFEYAVSSDAVESGRAAAYPWDLKNGFDIKIIKTKGQKSGKQKFAPNKWEVRLLAPKTLEIEELEKMADKINDLTKQYQIFSPEELQKILDGELDPFAKKEETVVEATENKKEEKAEKAEEEVENTADVKSKMKSLTKMVEEE